MAHNIWCTTGWNNEISFWWVTTSYEPKLKVEFKIDIDTFVEITTEKGKKHMPETVLHYQVARNKFN
jgi:hypothetical protein